MRGAQAVEWFKGYMLRKLHENSHKSDWKKEHPDWLMLRMAEERKELESAIESYFAGEIDPATAARHVIRECADVANFAMMVAERIASMAADNPRELTVSQTLDYLGNRDRPKRDLVVRSCQCCGSLVDLKGYSILSDKVFCMLCWYACDGAPNCYETMLRERFPDEFDPDLGDMGPFL